ncbi:MAG: aminoacyl-histidine dipeptidase [Bacteroidetes bacterium]|nr:aminoacyl-histidine dipeptidase [Bacteroidota bacterium]
MDQKIANLKPERLWHYFNEILEIPRPSKKEEKIIEYLLKFGKKNNLETYKDEVGNVIIKKVASAGKEKAKTVVLQSHMDMVCEKNSDKIHDFEKDPITAYIDGEWVKAKGTTLGADDGIGIAAQLAILESKEIEHGPLECLFTADEETGLTGARHLAPSLLKGKVLLNLDSEDEGQLYIGCAGGKDTTIEMPYKKEAVPKEFVSLKITVNGLKGGHSGDDIQKGLGNANKILNRLLWMVSSKFDLKLALFDGGNLRNAIAREAYAIVCVSESDSKSIQDFVATYFSTLKNEYKLTDAGLNIQIEKTDKPKFIIDQYSKDNLLNSLYACPHGVLAYSASIADFVETSTNLAAVKFSDDFIKITTSQRSSVESSKIDATNMVRATFTHTKAKIYHSDGYPGWTPNPNSEIVRLTAASYRSLFNKDPKVLAIHAGLECGLIGDIYPEMDMISFGPTIKGAHSPDERLRIESTVKFWNLLIDVLKKI